MSRQAAFSSQDQRYQETLDWIYSWIDFSMKRHVDDKHRFFKLDRMNRLMDLLGHPERHYPCVHVAGTKGKGSTASLIAAALEAAGYKVGLYTSPHLEDFRERITINGEMISEADVIRLADELRPLTEIVPETTTFELTTALAFQYYFQQNIDIAVIEVGLGGRLDATNVIDPLVSVITSISYDHMSVLGSTLQEIAAEKGGIIKPGCPVVLSPQKEEAARELKTIASERGAPLIRSDHEYECQLLGHDLKTQTFTVVSKLREIRGKNINTRTPLKLTMPLLGAHQIENACTAVAALDQIHMAGFHLTRKDIQKGFRQVVWPARFEILREDPPVVIDSAHNGDSMERLTATLDEYFPGMPFILVFGASEDKSMEDMLKAILPRVELVIATQSIHPRAASAKNLAEIVKEHTENVIPVCPAEAALQKALELAGDSRGILVTGSIFIAAAAKVIWSAHHQDR
ncbi:MAG: bifunctional folylpolyglutamate synthase/dihydrofolate synthase [Anaerolineaceae bacterium]|jgi:dihydrofolate synthase/folylpolyglutamate synthase